MNGTLNVFWIFFEGKLTIESSFTVPWLYFVCIIKKFLGGKYLHEKS